MNGQFFDRNINASGVHVVGKLDLYSGIIEQQLLQVGSVQMLKWKFHSRELMLNAEYIFNSPETREYFKQSSITNECVEITFKLQASYALLLAGDFERVLQSTAILLETLRGGKCVLIRPRYSKQLGECFEYRAGSGYLQVVAPKFEAGKAELMLIGEVLECRGAMELYIPAGESRFVRIYDKKKVHTLSCGPLKTS